MIFNMIPKEGGLALRGKEITGTVAPANEIVKGDFISEGASGEQDTTPEPSGELRTLTSAMLSNGDYVSYSTSRAAKLDGKGHVLIGCQLFPGNGSSGYAAVQPFRITKDQIEVGSILQISSVQYSYCDYIGYISDGRAFVVWQEMQSVNASHWTYYIKAGIINLGASLQVTLTNVVTLDSIVNSPSYKLYYVYLNKLGDGRYTIVRGRDTTPTTSSQNIADDICILTVSGTSITVVGYWTQITATNVLDRRTYCIVGTNQLWVSGRNETTHKITWYKILVGTSTSTIQKYDAGIANDGQYVHAIAFVLDGTKLYSVWNHYIDGVMWPTGIVFDTETLTYLKTEASVLPYVQGSALYFDSFYYDDAGVPYGTYYKYGEPIQNIAVGFWKMQVDPSTYTLTRVLQYGVQASEIKQGYYPLHIEYGIGSLLMYFTANYIDTNRVNQKVQFFDIIAAVSNDTHLLTEYDPAKGIYGVALEDGASGATISAMIPNA